MTYSQNWFAGVGLLLLSSFGMGCHHDPKPVAMYRSSDSNQGRVAVLPNSYVDLELPTVVIDHGNTAVSGSVRRKPGIRWTLSGRVDIEFVSPAGEVLDWLPALVLPKTISMDPNIASFYSTTYGYVPPQGSTVRVHFVDSDTAAQEDLEGNTIYTSAGGATGVGGGGHPTGAAHPTGAGHGGAHTGMGFH